MIDEWPSQYVWIECRDAKEKYIGKYFPYQNDSVGTNAVNHELVLTVESLIAALSAVCTTTSATTTISISQWIQTSSKEPL